MAMKVQDNGATVTVFRVSPFSKKEHEMVMPLTLAQFNACYNEWQAGVKIQNAFSMLNADQREFLMTGITPAEWDKAFG